MLLMADLSKDNLTSGYKVMAHGDEVAHILVY